ncbi:MAG TPA: lysophospholipid acyltransferase family protein [Stellaceae bacterium]|nr:lysophospholipid acyltransferase family protein [Stellaceae bacterium]
MILVRSLLFQVLFYLGTAVMAVVALPLLLMPWRWIMRYGTVWSDLTLRLLHATVGLDYEVRGAEHLPPGPAIVAMKHQSAWDTLAAPVIFRDPVVVIKRELGWIPFYGWYALKAGMIAIDRRAGPAALRSMARQGERAKADGRKIVIFPEGTRVAVGAAPAYQPGVFALYRQLALPLVPVAVNSGLYWGRRHFSKRPGRIIVEILPPIPAGGARAAVMQQLETAIETASARLAVSQRTG